MGGYIGARSGISATVANVQDVTATDTTPEVTIVNNTFMKTQTVGVKVKLSSKVNSLAVKKVH